MSQHLLIPDLDGADLSPKREFRYALWRHWEEKGDCVAFIGLNPSTADERLDDPTIRRCIAFAKRWGYSGMFMMNLFAFRATDPRHLRAAGYPVGPENDQALAQHFARAKLIVAAWGKVTNRIVHRRAVKIAAACRLVDSPVKCLGYTMCASPRHPLYVRGDTELVPFYMEETPNVSE